MSSSSSFSAISMTYQNQFSTSWPWTPGLCRELCSLIWDRMQCDGGHSSQLVLFINHCIYVSYDITDLNSTSEISLEFSCSFLTELLLAGWYHVHWSSVNLSWAPEHWHGPTNPCTCTDELSCFTIWSLESTKSWQVAKFLHEVLFQEIYCQK